MCQRSGRQTLQDIAMRPQRGPITPFASSEQMDTPKSKLPPAYSDVP
jgi:hypothetical protein